MNDLLNKKCVPCEGGVSSLDLSEIHKYQKKVDGWDLKKNEGQIYFFCIFFDIPTIYFFLIFVNFTDIER